MASKIKNGKKEPEVYVNFLDSKNKYRVSKKDFATFEEALHWIYKTFDNPSKDFIKYY